MKFHEHPDSIRRREKKPKPKRRPKRVNPVLIELSVGAGLDALLDGEDETEAVRRRKLVLEEGNPRQQKIGPLEREEIARMYLQHVPLTVMAKKFGVSIPCIRNHITRHIRPVWQERLKEDLGRDLQVVAMLEGIAWERFYASTKPADSKQVKIETQPDDAETERLAQKRAKRVVEKVLNRKYQIGSTDWLKAIQWCLEFRAKIHGSFAPQKHQHDLSGELRVAGLSPAELDEAMMERLAGKMAERRQYEAMMRGQGDN